ncbi:MAG: sigma-70 family RNA polymerase sigma factor [Holophagales bacterium]|nr:sigma-70 family RNA polymerase sigma factor [Holophagales bacterium]
MGSEQTSDLSVTDLLVQWREGDDEALEQLTPRVYHELRRLAGSQLRGERPGQTLSVTDLVHEAFLRLVDVEVSWQDRAHFLAVGARMMRRILVDRSRAKSRTKRGAGAQRVSLEDTQLGGELDGEQISIELLALDRAIEVLSKVKRRRGRAVELFYFGGLTYEEVAVALGVSRATAHRDLRLARAWLEEHLELGRPPPGAMPRAQL